MALALIVPVLLVALWAGYRIYIYRKALRYSPSAPSAYELGEGLAISGVLPSDQPAGTLLLEVTAKSSLLGHLFDPRVTICVGNRDFEFYFERGISASRHLVLPFEPGAPLSMTGAYVSASLGKGWIFPRSTFEGVAIVAPHPDDAEIAAFGVYRSHPDSVHILNVTKGEKGTSHDAPGLDREAQQQLVGELRSFDARTIPLLSAVSPERIRDLGWNESEFPLSAERRGDLVNAITEFLKATGAKRIVCPHPVLDSHKVHRDIALATIEAILILEEPGIELWASLIHVPNRRSYPIGPMGSGLTLPPTERPLKAFARLETFWLTEDDRLMKVFALDANHDLRLPPAPFAKETDLFTLSRRRFRQWLTGTERMTSTDYYRRSVRACELFLVYTHADLLTLRDQLA